MKNNTACPLDCYDACEIVYEDAIIKGSNEGYTNGFLCPHLNHYESFQRITQPKYKGLEISLQEALKKLSQILQESKRSEVLQYRGNGNFALMQGVTDHFFAQYGATLTDGNLCDGAGESGIIVGRGSNKNMPLSEIEKSDVVIFWGRNPHVTSSHLLPIVKDKQIIVIDPVETKIAKSANLFVQIKPHTDIYFAMLLTRFLHIEGACDETFLQEYASEFEEYYELTQNIRIKATLDAMDLTLGQIGDVLSLVKDKKVAIVTGLGVQKYRDGADVIRAIDAFAVALGLFGKEGCGVAYLGNSKEGIEMPFNNNAKRVSKVDTPFDMFKTVFIQGANPLSQMPNSLHVKNSISSVENIVYFGLYENESSQIADLVIPAKNFLEKNDVRTSYSHHKMLFMPKQKESDIGVSEYELSRYLCDTFDIDLESEQFYLEHFRSFSYEQDGTLHVKSREDVPYKNGFDTSDKEFVFLDELDVTLGDDEKLFLITPKSAKSLNSQFKRDEYVYLNASHGYEDEEQVNIVSEVGTVRLKVKNEDTLRHDCVLIYSGTKGLNNITTSKHSYEGKNAIYQELKVEIQ